MKKHSRILLSMLLVISLLLSNFAMIVSNAVIQDYTVELAFNNIFVFDKWANNSLSTTIVNGGKPVSDKLDIDIENGSFRFNNPYSGESYTGHGMGTGLNAAGNYQYYVMEVEPDSAYTFSYNVSGTVSYITPYVFFFNENNEYVSLVAQPFAGSGDTDFVFTTPSNVHYIQIRFTIPEKGYADVKDIAIRKTDVVSHSSNLFDFSAWNSNAKSNKISDEATYAGGTVTTNATDKSVTLTVSSNTTGYVFTNFTFGNGKDGYYTIDIEPDTLYNLSYNLVSCNFNYSAYQPYVVFFREDGSFISYMNTESVGLGDNGFVFKSPADADFIQIVYAIVGVGEAGKTCTVKDLAVQKINLQDDVSAGLPHRLVYTYSKNSNATYGELPVPTYAPEGYVFAGWYTGKNGTGTLITKDTPIDYSSHTVYPKYDLMIDSLSILEMPIKRDYTVGERVNPAGLVLEATISGAKHTIDSGFYCTPEYITSEGVQTITAHYGGKTATFTVNASKNVSRSVVINGSNVNVNVANNTYTLTGNLNTGDFNYYTLTYYSDAYVKGIITYGDGETEEFFLEPSTNFSSANGEFSSYIDGYLQKVINAKSETVSVNSITRNGIKSISFTLLDNKTGTFDLLTVNTTKKSVNTNETTKYFNNDKYKVGIDILNGGVVTYLEVLNSNIVARVYNTTDAYGNATTMTRVDYADKLPGGYISENKNVNLINYYDNGRELQQSYYGTGEKPYEQGYYNRADWNYNPVQAGNVINEASKVIDYEITDEYIYIKARPLDWAKWSDDFANKSSSDAYDPIYGDEYITDTYVEAKYVFEDGLVKTYCRMVDYSGYPSAQTTQELPAFYTIEPLNHYVYNDVSEDEAWKTKNLKYDEEPEFWGIAQSYRDAHYPNGFSANTDCTEHWAAFTASEDADSFGIGLYSPEVTNFYYGVYPQKYAETADFGQTNTLNYRHAQTNNPAVEDDSSYIAPIGVRTFESFKPSEYAFYISTGTVDQIRNSFGVIDDEGFAEGLKTGKIVVPETIYMTPSTGESKTGQYYVNNILDKATNTVTLEAKNDNTNAYVQFNIPGAKDVTISVNTITSGIGDIVLNESTNIKVGNLGHSYEDMSLGSIIDADGYFSYQTAGLYINGTGLKAGESAVAEWVFTVTMYDNSVRTYYAYSTLYAPNYHSVGATAEARYNTSNRVDGAGWISGIHTVSTSLAPFGKSSGVDGQGAFKSEPLLGLSSPMTPQDWGSANNLTTSSDGLIYAREYYKNSEGGSNEQSPVGILYVDYSRNKNTNTIPNLYVGAELLKADSGTNTSCHFYSFYTLGTGSEFTNPSDSSTPSGWNQFVNLGSSNGTYNGTVASTLTVSNLSNFVNILRDANSGRSLRIYTAPDLTIKASGTQYIYLFAQIRKNSSRYANMYAATQIITVDKGDLRNLVLEGTMLNAENYTQESWSNYIKELRIAAANLGNPSASSVIDTSALVKARNALQTKVTLNANGGNFVSSGSSSETKEFNVTVGSGLSYTYDVSSYAPIRTGYTLNGWSTDMNASEGASSVKAGLMPKLYAVWSENSYKVVYNANGGSGYIKNKTATYTEKFALESSGFARDGYTFLGWSTDASAETPTYTPGQVVSELTSNNEDTITLYAVWLREVEEDADYSKVNALITEANKYINDESGIYENVDALKEAVNSVVTGLKKSDQEIVDGYENSIREALGNIRIKSGDYSAVEDAINDANEKRAQLELTGVAIIPETLEALEKAINNVVYGLDITNQDIIDGFTSAIKEATDALDNVSTILIAEGSELYFEEDGGYTYIRGFDGVSGVGSANDITSQFVTFGSDTNLVVIKTDFGWGTGTRVQHFDGDKLIKEYIIIVDGDINGSGYADAEDVAILTTHINEFTEPGMDENYNLVSPWYKKAVDLCNDDWLDVIDLTILISMANFDSYKY